jgi:hypothetical protein
MTAWHLRGRLLEFCNCAPGCDCNFRGVPSSDAGNCEAFVCHQVDEGRFGEIDMAGVRWVMAYWWPGAIHDKGGRARGFVDETDDDRFEAMRTIIRGEAGHPFFEIFNSTYDEPPAVERAPIDVVFEGRESRFSVRDVGEAVMAPLRNPVTGVPNDVRIVKPGGFIWKDGEIAQGAALRVDLPGISFEHTGRHAVIAPFDWTVEEGQPVAPDLDTEEM